MASLSVLSSRSCSNVASCVVRTRSAAKLWCAARLYLRHLIVVCVFMIASVHAPAGACLGRCNRFCLHTSVLRCTVSHDAAWQASLPAKRQSWMAGRLSPGVPAALGPIHAAVQPVHGARMQRAIAVCHSHAFASAELAHGPQAM